MTGWLGWGVQVPRDRLQLRLEAGARRCLADVLWQARLYRRAWLAAEREDA